MRARRLDHHFSIMNLIGINFSLPYPEEKTLYLFGGDHGLESLDGTYPNLQVKTFVGHKSECHRAGLLIAQSHS
jgi:hypothetical protein